VNGKGAAVHKKQFVFQDIWFAYRGFGFILSSM